MHQMNFSEGDELIRFVADNNIKILNLCHIPDDGRLKTLSFSAADKERLSEILDLGERIDASSLFSFVEPGKSDIYIMPRLSRAFRNPFAAAPTLNVMCNYVDHSGRPWDVAPQNVLARAEENLGSSTGVSLRALAELEYYVIAERQPEMLFPGAPDKNYHDSAPFARFEDLRNEVLIALSSAGIATKYAHGEVGRVFGKDGSYLEQHEIEFTAKSLAEAAETVAIAKWMVRNVCVKYGVSASFSPKVSLEHAGSGMHIHLCGLKNRENIVTNRDMTLSTLAKEMIGGILRLAPSLSAFGNTTPPSYLRFIARKESPMHICWGDRNRLALVRIPLWWSFRNKITEKESCRETLEYRAPDPLANPFLLLAGIAIAVNHGLSNSQEAAKLAEDLYIEPAGRKKRLEPLPSSCCESAKNLGKDRLLYEANGTFPKTLIDKTIEKLRAYDDEDLWKNLGEKREKTENFLKQYLHFG